MFLLVFLAFYAGFLTLVFIAIRVLARAFPAAAHKLWSGKVRWLTVAVLLWFNAAPWLFFAAGDWAPTPDSLTQKLLLYPSFIFGLASVGIAVGMATVMIAAAPFRAGAGLLRRRRGTKEPATDDDAETPPRRAFLRAATGTVAVAATGVSGWGILGGSERLTVEPVTLTHPALPASLDGLRIVQLSDIHAGPYMWRERLAEYVARVNELKPDVVVITGDIVNHGLDSVDTAAQELARLQTRFGTFATLGNHDHWADPRAVTRGLEDAGIPVLNNSAVTFADRVPGGEKLALVGIDDPTGAPGGSYGWMLRQALADVPESADIRILLSHRPNVFPEAAHAGLALTLSGHTHGGQIALPVPGRRPLTVARLATDYEAGLYADDATRSWCYVNRGLGVAALPLRLNCPREITVVTLRRGPLAALHGEATAAA